MMALFRMIVMLLWSSSLSVSPITNRLLEPTISTIPILTRPASYSPIAYRPVILLLSSLFFSFSSYNYRIEVMSLLCIPDSSGDTKAHS